MRCDVMLCAPSDDIGMAAMFVSEADALTTLAITIGRNDTATMLKARADSQVGS